jgi:hydroxymethylpyrimidine pyrophosphatase-like HAD family hydrolase
VHLTVLACDLDGTLAEHGQVAAETWDVLRRAREAGLALLLVTGRVLDTFAADGPFAEVFEAVLAEEGAAVYFTRNDGVMLPFGRLAPDCGTPSSPR